MDRTAQPRRAAGGPRRLAAQRCRRLCLSRGTSWPPAGSSSSITPNLRDSGQSRRPPPPARCRGCLDRRGAVFRQGRWPSSWRTAAVPPWNARSPGGRARGLKRGPPATNRPAALADDHLPRPRRRAPGIQQSDELARVSAGLPRCRRGAHRRCVGRRGPRHRSLQCIQNGTFEADAIGGGAAKWRLLGTHKTQPRRGQPRWPGQGASPRRHRPARTHLQYRLHHPGRQSRHQPCQNL